jgi:hypothetical protein
MMEEQRKAAAVSLQFEDGAQLDTCAPIGPSRFSDKRQRLLEEERMF